MFFLVKKALKSLSDALHRLRFLPFFAQLKIEKNATKY
jgi:hypothetical protein